jgi:hypothetical protein
MATKKALKPNPDWRMHTIVCGDTDRKRVWGMWATGPHCGLHMSGMYPSKSEAMSAAREGITKGWWDRVIVREIHLGKCEELLAPEDPKIEYERH